MTERCDLNILDSCDDFLTEIFVYLNLRDLLQLYKIHLRFHEAIGNVLLNKCVTVHENWDDDEIENIENFLIIFGDKVKILRIEESNVLAEKLIKNYLFGGNVKTCELIYFDINEKFIDNNLKFLRSLKSLSLQPYEANYDSVLKLIEMTNLEVLEVNCSNLDCKFFGRLSTCRLKRLKVLSGNYLREYVMNLPAFDSIRELDLYARESFYSSFLDHFPNVESLTLNIPQANSTIFNSILNLSNLKCLKLEIRWKLCSEIDPFLISLAKLNNLESFLLHIQHFKFTRSICKTICEMTNLRELDVSAFEIPHLYLQEIGKKLTKLRKISMRPLCCSSQLETIENLSKFVRVGRNFTTIIINGLRLFKMQHCEQLYDKISKIRRNQEHKFLLNFIITNGFPTVCFETGKWVKMRIPYCKSDACGR